MAAWYYMVVSFPTEPLAEVAERSFQDLRLSLDGRELPSSEVSRWQCKDGSWWVTVIPSGVSHTGRDERIVTSDAQIDVIAAQLYEQLRGLDGFLCAVAGWEVMEHFMPDAAHGTYDDLRVDIPLNEAHALPGLVIGISVWARHGRPSKFEPFMPGYVWRPQVARTP